MVGLSKQEKWSPTWIVVLGILLLGASGFLPFVRISVLGYASAKGLNALYFITHLGIASYPLELGEGFEAWVAACRRALVCAALVSWFWVLALLLAVAGYFRRSKSTVVAAGLLALIPPLLLYYTTSATLVLGTGLSMGGGAALMAASGIVLVLSTAVSKK